MPRAAKPGPPDVASVLRTLERLAAKKVKEGMARYGIPSDHALGVPVGALQKLARQLGRDHALAAGLWQSGCYEARMLACLVDDPAQVTPGQMDRWARDFDNWAICDTACFHLFDRTPHAFRKIKQWAGRKEEFVRRAAFALLASAALHDRKTDDEPFARCLPLIERAAGDERNFVKKGVSWALRSVGRRSPSLHAAALAMAQRLAAASTPAQRWIGKDALRDLQRAAVKKRLAKKA